MNKNILILICGTGSTGQRHSKNLINLGFKNLIFFKQTKKSKPNWIKKFKIYTNINSALKQKPKVTFICNVTSKHLKYALICARAKSHLFVEKPLSNKIQGLNKLNKILKKNKLKLMVGYMMRFHPLIIKIKKLLKKKYLGNIFYVRSIWSEYLPDWHPQENFKKSYASLKKLGGGSALTLSHEIDLIKWYFGKIDKISTYNSFNSKLKIDAEFSTNHQIKFKNGIIAQIHLDFMQKPYERKLEILGDKRKLLFNYYENQILITDRKGNVKKIIEKKFDRNKMFIDEIKKFFECINKNLKIESDIVNSIEIIKKIKE
jgi:predicted dehydrogenase